MFITRKHLSRRTVLRGVGAAIALPLLDAMIPARTALAATAAAPNPKLGFVYFPHGAVMDRWKPEAAGQAFEFPQILKPLEPYRSYTTVVSGLRNKGAESPDPHGIIAGTWLSCVGPKDRETTGERGVTADQLAAHYIGQGHSLALIGALRRKQRRSRLRTGSRVRVRGHGGVPHAHPAAAHGAQSPQGFLPDVRAGRYAGRARRDRR